MSYERRIIGFVDVLGFGQLVFDSENDNEKLNLIERVISKIQNVDDMYGSPDSFFAHSNYQFVSNEMKAGLSAIYEKIKADAGASRVSITTFSDSIVFSCSANSDGLSSFRYFLIKLLVQTSEFSLLLRGGVSCGSLIHTDRTVFGPAMNRAYLAESKLAKHPRIAVDDHFYSFLQEVNGDNIGKIVLSELIVDPEDEVIYFDSLLLATSKVAQNLCGANAYEILANESKTIGSIRASANGLTDAMLKINWYASYFNRHLERCQEVEVVTSSYQGLPFESEMVSVSDLKVQNSK